MSDFKSLKADRGFAGSLLRSAAGDAPSAQARRLAASTLGLGIGMVVTTSVVPSALAAGTTLGTATAQVVVPTGVKAISVLSVTKWLASSFVVGVVASSSAITVHEVVSSHQAPELTLRAQPSPLQGPARAARLPQPAPVLVPRAPANPAPAPEAPAPESPTPPSHSHSGASAAANVRGTSISNPESSSRGGVAQPAMPGARAQAQAAFPASPATNVASLDEEIAWLEPARRSLQAGDGRQALVALDRATQHVRLLASEAALLRVEALLLVGRRAEAERIAEPFMSRYPSSLHAERLRRLLAQP